MNIVVTRERGSNDELRSWMPIGAQVEELPLTTTTYVPVEVVVERVGTLAPKTGFPSLVVTSQRTKAFLTSVRPHLSSQVEVFSVGASTTAAIESCGLSVKVQSLGTSLDLAGQISRGPVLLLGAAGMKSNLRDSLVERGLKAHHVTCYETVSVQLSVDEQDVLRSADVVLIGAPSAWRVAQSFVSQNALVVVPGASTAEVVRRSHERVLEGWGPTLASQLV